jgi:endonuclease I
VKEAGPAHPLYLFISLKNTAMKSLLTVLMVSLSIVGCAQPDADYYASATGTGYTLKTQLYNIINGHSTQGYRSMWDFIEDNDRDKYYENDNSVLDIYSENPTGTDPYNWTAVSDQCGNVGSNEGTCYNREHSVPASWFNDSSPMFSDAVHLFPTDGQVNGRRGSYPFGEVGSASWTSLNGSKLGSARSGLGYSGTVFEPIDEFKGDLARVYFYMATRYQNVITQWNSPMLDGSSNKVFTTWALNMLLDWHESDPVSQKERDRNNAIENYQGNRNPYVDHPEWAACVWNNDCDDVDPGGGEGEVVTSVSTQPSIESIYPNPASGIVKVAHLPAPKSSYRLFDSSGARQNLVWQSDDLDVTGLPVGVYYLSVQVEGKSRVFRLLIR